jgi:hypothetical protein
MALIKKLKVPIVLFFLFLGTVNLFKLIKTIPGDDAYRKDFFQEYLLARAVMAGLPVYTPLPELAERLEGPLPFTIFPQPSPHPPAVLIFALPLAFFSYRTALIIWLVVELTLLFFTCRLLLRRYFGVNQWWASLLVAIGLIATFPVSLELAVGQLMLLTLFLLTAGWLALRSSNDIQGGALLGLSLVVKFIGWPLILFLIFRKRWRAVLAAGSVFLVANVVGGLIVGLNQAAHYYRYVAPIGSKLYESEFLNFSTWASGRRLFAGTSNSILQTVNIEALFNAPAVAPLMAVILTLSVVCLALLLAHRVADFDLAVAILVCASAVVNPIAWHHYLVLLVMPAAVSIKGLMNSSFPARTTIAAALIGLALLLPHLDHLANSMAVGNPPKVPAPLALLAFVPLVATIGLMLLVWSISKGETLRQTRLTPK